MDSYNRDRDQWNAQRAEIEQEIERIRNRYYQEPFKISYDLYSSIYKQIIDSSFTIDSNSLINMRLNEEKWMNLLRVLSKFRLPSVNRYNIDFAPNDSDMIREFLQNIDSQSVLCFNWNKTDQIDGNKYIDVLKIAASKTASEFGVHNANFSARNLIDLISAAKHINKIYFYWNTIPFDNEVEFTNNMDGC